MGKWAWFFFCAFGTVGTSLDKYDPYWPFTRANLCISKLSVYIEEAFTDHWEIIEGTVVRTNFRCNKNPFYPRCFFPVPCITERILSNSNVGFCCGYSWQICSVMNKIRSIYSKFSIYIIHEFYPVAFCLLYIGYYHSIELSNNLGT